MWTNIYLFYLTKQFCLTFYYATTLGLPGYDGFPGKFSNSFDDFKIKLFFTFEGLPGDRGIDGRDGEPGKKGMAGEPGRPGRKGMKGLAGYGASLSDYLV